MFNVDGSMTVNKSVLKCIGRRGNCYFSWNCFETWE